MSAITSQKLRVGNFTSSEIAALTTNGKLKGTLGKPAYTYIDECNYERKLGRSIESESNARPLSWGKLVEGRAFDLLGLEYKLVSYDTIVHPVYECWAGSPDAEKFDDGKTVVDIKCPITLKSFCQLVECQTLYGTTLEEGLSKINHIRAEHKDGEKYYWQLVSNAILTNAKYAELIVYCPYFSELEAIQELAQNIDSSKQHQYQWIAFSLNDELPYIPDGNEHYNNINVIRFEVPQEDKDFLTDRVKTAKELLITV